MIAYGDTLNVSGTSTLRKRGSQTSGWSSKMQKSSHTPVFRGTHQPAGLRSTTVTMIPPASRPHTRSSSRVCHTVDTKGWTSRWHNASRASICACEDVTSVSSIVSTSTYSSLAGRRGYQITRKLPANYPLLKYALQNWLLHCGRPPDSRQPLQLGVRETWRVSLRREGHSKVGKLVVGIKTATWYLQKTPTLGCTYIWLVFQTLSPSRK